MVGLTQIRSSNHQQNSTKHKQETTLSFIKCIARCPTDAMQWVCRK